MIIQTGCSEPLWGRLSAGPRQPAFRTCSLTRKCLQRPRRPGCGCRGRWEGEDHAAHPRGAKLGSEEGGPRRSPRTVNELLAQGRGQGGEKAERGMRSEEGPCEGSSGPVA